MLATLSELRDFLQDQNVPEEAGTLGIEDASSQVVTYCDGMNFGIVEDEEILVDGSGTRVILLPSVPVSDVASVKEDGTELIDGEDFEWSADGILRGLNRVFRRRYRFYEVTYSHGFAPTSDEMKAVRGVVLRTAARSIINPGSVANESIASYAVGYGFDDSRSAVLTAADKRILDGIRP